MRSLRLGVAVLGMVLAPLACFSAAAGAQVTVGQLSSAGLGLPCEFSQPADEIVTEAATGTSYVVPPPGGVVTAWSTASFIASPNQRLGLKVFRPAGPNTFTALAQDERALTPATLNTFQVSIPVQAGDLIGMHIPSESEVGSVECYFQGTAESKWAYLEGSAAIGVPTPFTEAYESPDLLNVSATVLPPPSVAAISPAGGSVKGGASVTISGTNFARVTGVSFGSAPAQSFTVGSEGQISAVAPASSSLVSVPVSVTTEAGSASAPTQFAYEGCKVPKLKGKKLKAAKKSLAKAGCKLGKVKKKGGATSKTGKVAKQSPAPGTILAPAGKVKVTLKP